MIDFDVFWKFYPRRVGKMKAQKIWAKMNDYDQHMAMLGLGLWKQTFQWQQAGGLYIPYASTFLHQRRWEDEPWDGAFEGK